MFYVLFLKSGLIVTWRSSGNKSPKATTGTAPSGDSDARGAELALGSAIQAGIQATSLELNIQYVISGGGVSMEWYLQALKKYTVFDGRARRKEFWMFVLFNIIISFALGFVDGFADLILITAGGYVIGILSGLYYLFILIPTVALWVRRLHDTGRSGWYLFLLLIPLVGVILFFVFSCTDSQPGENSYGPNPKETASIPPPITS